MSAVKPGSRAAVNMASAQVGVVLQVESNNIALVRMRSGNHVRVRADTLRGKSAPPMPGESWIFDQVYGIGWQFAVPVDWSADRNWLAPTMKNSWTSVGAPYLPVGYRRTLDDRVLLCGAIQGGTRNLAAFTLPQRYLPEAKLVFAVPSGSPIDPHNATYDPNAPDGYTNVAQLSVSATGDVVSSTATRISLDGVSFMAAT